MRQYKLSRAADRQAMADRLAAHFARVEGVTVTNAPHEFDPREINVVVSAAGARCTVDIDGDSTWGLLAHWNLDYRTREGRLFSGRLQDSVGRPIGHRPHHKATGPHVGEGRRGESIDETQLDIFAATINRAMRLVVSGEAFEQEQAA